MPSDLVQTFTYDCFGNGDYRRPTRARHTHSVALVQIANELAAARLCHPLIPTPRADTRSYIRAFFHRLHQAITLLRQRVPDALLCLVVDAADNSQMEARDMGQGRSFILDLLSETLPDGVRLVVLCRSHRRDILDLPLEHVDIPLSPFSREETERHLLGRFPEATSHDVDEFHRLTSENPRVQALAMDQAYHDQRPLDAMLRGLGPNPKTVQSAIDALLDHALARIRDQVRGSDRVELDQICIGLAVLRPFIPISVLATMSGVPEPAIRSFATDLGRGLQVTGNSVQFIDEPTETWFRERFRPPPSDLSTFVDTLKPWAASQPYVAASLPRLMLEAGRLDDLLGMTLTSQGLPDGPMERRDVEVQRLQFALKATLRAERFADAAKLAFKAAVASAAGDRQARLLRENTDIVAVFRTPDSIQEIVIRRVLATDEPGTHYAYEAALFSHFQELKGDARSRNRMAHDEIRSWLQQSEDHFATRISDVLLAELTMVRVNIPGPANAAGFLRSWRPREVALRVGLLLSRRLMDHGRYNDLNKLALAAGNDIRVILAITAALRSAHYVPPEPAVARAFRLLLDRRVKVQEPDVDLERNVLAGVVALVEATCKYGIGSPSQRAELLTRYLPAMPLRSLSSRWGSNGRSAMIRATALLAAFLGNALDLLDLAHPDLRKEIEEDRPHHTSRDVEEFKNVIGQLLPWHSLYVEALLGHIALGDLPALMETAQATASRISQHTYQEGSVTLDEVAVLRLSLLIEMGAADGDSMASYTAWLSRQKQSIRIPTLIAMTWLAARTPRLEERALEWANAAKERIQSAREGAEAISSVHIDICRAILPLSRRGAEECFDEAIAVAGKIGDEHIARWESLLDVADKAVMPTRPNPELAYRLARGAELICGYSSDHFDWNGTVRAVAGLCPASSFAILARWRDRNFGNQDRLLPEVVEYLARCSALAPKTGLALVPFRGSWDKPELLELALKACCDDLERRTVATFLHRYMALDGAQAETWRRVKELTERYGIQLPDIEERIALAAIEEDRRHRHDRQFYQVPPIMDEDVWEGIFNGLDVLTPSGISEAKDRLAALAPSKNQTGFISEAIRRVRVGAEPEFITALTSLPDTDRWDLRQLLDDLPANWAVRPGVKTALAGGIKTVCQRSCLSFSLPRHYDSWPVEKGCALSGLDLVDLVRMVVTAVGQSPDVLATGRLFSLVGLLARLLSNAEAAAVLSYGLGLFEGELQDNDGDGPWTDALAPPVDVSMAMAGYVWSALAAPDTEVRWQAAHVVRALGRLRCASVVEHIIALYDGGRGGPFVDANLRFYSYHARQWLMVGLARMAMESPTMLVRHWDFLVKVALEGVPHAVIRRLAVQAAMAMLDCGLIPGNEALRARLDGMTRPLTATTSDGNEEITVDLNDHDEDDAEGSGFSFQMDIGPYWLNPLGRIFGLAQAEVGRLMRTAIRDEMHYLGRGWWDEDLRGTRNIYPEGLHRYSRGSYPRVHDLRIYHCYHAMMLVAGRLLGSTAIRRPEPGRVETWEYWLSDHIASLPDGTWLFDQRDPMPLYRPSWRDEEETKDWRWSVKAADFEAALFTTDGRVNVWGNWTFVDGVREETICVRSALVGSESSTALLRALQTTDDAHDYRLPNARDSASIHKAGFRLKGWVRDQSGESGQGSKDSWAGGISWPQLSPTPFVLRIMSLCVSVDGRTWSGASGAPVIWSSLWGGQFDEDGLRTVEAGRRLQTGLPFLLSMLKRLGMDMIIEVEIDRRRSRSHHQDSSDVPFQHYGNYARLFLIKPDGRILAT